MFTPAWPFIVKRPTKTQSGATRWIRNRTRAGCASEKVTTASVRSRLSPVFRTRVPLTRTFVVRGGPARAAAADEPEAAAPEVAPSPSVPVTVLPDGADGTRHVRKRGRGRRGLRRRGRRRRGRHHRDGRHRDGKRRRRGQRRDRRQLRERAFRPCRGAGRPRGGGRLVSSSGSPSVPGLARGGNAAPQVRGRC